MNVPRIIRRLFRRPYDGLRHWGVVDPGVLYRCGQPRPEELARLIEQDRIRTVVALRGLRRHDDPDAWEAAERAVCAAHGVRFTALPCNHRHPPTVEQLRAFLELVQDPASRPVLVHCRLGQQRTLLLCGLYEVHIRGRDPREVLAEMDRLGFGSRRRRHRRLVQAFHELCRASVAPRAREEPQGAPG